MSIQKGSCWWNNGSKNKRSVSCPGEGYVKGRLKFKRAPHSEETKTKISCSLKGNIPWNIGLKTGPESDDTRARKSNSAKGNKNAAGSSAWNKGLTKDTDARVKLNAENQSNQTRVGNYARGKDHPGFNPDKTEFQEYRKEVTIKTEQNYIKYKDIINPCDYNRGRCGQHDAYQLDHIISVKKGFDQNISTDIISDVDNLQMLHWVENRKKWFK